MGGAVIDKCIGNEREVWVAIPSAVFLFFFVSKLI